MPTDVFHAEETGKARARKAAATIAIGAALLALVALGIARCAGGGAVRVASFTPDGEIKGRAAVIVQFDEPMVSKAEVGKSPARPPLKFTPAVPGTFTWVSRSKLRFDPEADFPAGREIAVEVLRDAGTLAGARVGGRRKYALKTAPFGIDDVTVKIEYVDLAEDRATLRPKIDFSYLVDARALQDSLVLDLDGDGRIAYRVAYRVDAAEKSFVLETDPVVVPRDGERKLTVTLAKPLSTADGASTLAAGFSRTLAVKTSTDLEVESIAPKQVGDAFVIEVRFSSTLDAAALEPCLSITPAVDHRLETAYDTVTVVGDFTPGQETTVAVRQGCTARDGAKLAADFRRVVVFPDFGPVVRFASPGHYLPRGGAGNVGVRSVNVRKARTSLWKVFPNNLVRFLQDWPKNYDPGDWNDEHYSARVLGNVGEEVDAAEFDVAADPNARVVTPVDVGRFLAKARGGLFVLAVADAEEPWRRSDVRWVLATDLGIVAKRTVDGFVVFVNSLSTLAPAAGAEVSLLSPQNQTVASARAGADGVARLAFPKSGGSDPYLVLARQGDDVSFLKPSDTELSLADFDVGGADAPEAWAFRTYLYGDRGVYRPDDVAHFVALVRGRDLSPAAPMPVRLEVRSPDDRVFRVLQKTVGAGGAAAFDLEVPDWAMTGVYAATLKSATGAVLGSMEFQVESFVPDRIKVDLALDKPAYRAGESAKASVRARMLFGPPAAGRASTARCELRPWTIAPKAFPTFTFADPSRKFDPVPLDLGERRLGDDGTATVDLRFPEGLRPPSALQALVSATVRDEGGRAVTAQATADVHPFPAYVGVRKPEGAVAKPGEPIAVDVVAVTPDGQPAAGRGLTVTLQRLVWQTTLKRDAEGYYRYVSTSRDETVLTRQVTSGTAPVSVALQLGNVGEYRVVVADAGGARASIAFWASGWGYAPWAMSTPERLDLVLDKTTYRVGETATVQVRAPFGGKLLLTVERDRIFAQRIVEMPSNTATLTIPVEADWAPNAYVVGTLIRKVGGEDEHAPARAFGAAPVAVDRADRRIGLSLDLPEKMLPRRDLAVGVRAENAGGEAWVTIAAVDEGVLQLTGFDSPDPLRFFFAKERLSVTTCDLYSLVLPDVKGTRKSATGGDEAARRKNLNPIAIRRTRPVSLWSGVVKLDAQGRGSATLKVPQFNGSLRVMAVAFSGKRFAGASRNVEVADRLVLTPTVPLVLAPKDALSIPVSVFNKTGQAAEVAVTVQATGPLTITPARRTVTIGPEKEALVRFDAVAADAVGRVDVTFAAQAGDARTQEKAEVEVRAAAPLVFQGGGGVVPAGGSANVAVPGGFVRGTARPRLTVSGLPIARLGGSLQYVLHYPYGCVEQTTSSAFPLLYFADLAARLDPALFKDKSADHYVNAAIAKLEAMQLWNGGFSVWPGGTWEWPWGSVYATHFLVEARKAGYPVRDDVLDDAAKRLRAIAVGASEEGDDDEIDGGRTARRVYALYVLALLGKPEKGMAAYWKHHADGLADYSRFHLAGALALGGDAAGARALLPKQVTPSSATRATGGNFDSAARNTAVMLDVLLQVDPGNPQKAVLAKNLLDGLKVGRYGTTQEDAMVLLALGKLYRGAPAADFTGTVTPGGAAPARFDETGVTLTDPALAGSTVEIRITGTGEAYYSWEVEGVPATGDVKEYDADVEVRRRYLSAKGEQVDLAGVPQGELLIVEVSLRALTEDVDNVVVTDLVPGGVEIENPRLESREALPWVDEDAEDALETRALDIRDDRLVLFADLPARETRVFRYAARAVAAGAYVVPPIKAEAMYDPGKSSVASGGRMTIVAPK